MKKTLNNKDVEIYLIDCVGYGEEDIKEMYETYSKLWDVLNESERIDCLNYFE